MDLDSTIIACRTGAVRIIETGCEKAGADSVLPHKLT